MATWTAIAFNLFEIVDIVQPRIEVVVCEMECTVDRKPLRMQWIPDVDSDGRRVMRIQWFEEGGVNDLSRAE